MRESSIIAKLSTRLKANSSVVIMSSMLWMTILNFKGQVSKSLIRCFVKCTIIVFFFIIVARLAGFFVLRYGNVRYILVEFRFSLHSDNSCACFSQGSFVVCNSRHMYHRKCELVVEQKAVCPHCGHSSPPSDVHVSIAQERNPFFLPLQKSLKDVYVITFILRVAIGVCTNMVEN